MDMINNWYDCFMEALFERFPKRLQLSQALIDLLCIEREAVYRRLRRDVTFPVNEIVKIALEWNISLDDLIGINTGQVSFQMQPVNYLNPSPDELDYLRYIIRSINNLRNYPSTELMVISNKLPRQLLSGYKNLNKFYLFKWIYQYGHEKEVVPFSKIEVSGEKQQVDNEYNLAIKQIPDSSFIWDSRIFEYLISNIQYFNSIRMITDQEKDMIKEELIEMLDYLLKVAGNGCYPETQNKVNLYVSQLSVDTNYSYTFSPEAKICFIHVFEKCEIYTYNAEMAKNFKKWMQLKKRSSIQISEVDVRSRIDFFSKQQQLIDSL